MTLSLIIYLSAVDIPDPFALGGALTAYGEVGPPLVIV